MVSYYMLNIIALKIGSHILYISGDYSKSKELMVTTYTEHISLEKLEAKFCTLGITIVVKGKQCWLLNILA